MPRALMTCRNLIGDGLYSQPALEEWSKDHPGWEIDLLTNDDFISPIYQYMGIPNMRVVFDRMYRTYDFEFEFQVNKAFDYSNENKCHLLTSYGKMLGYDIEPRRVTFIPSKADDHEKGLVLFSMFSASCASRGTPPGLPNKMISWAHWLPILALGRQLGKVVVLGGPDDRAELPISEDEYYTGIPLELVARMMRDAKVLITLDNGMGHLAATQGTPTVLFYPMALGLHYIVPAGNPNCYVLQMDPVRLEVKDAVTFVRQSLRRIGGTRK
jgi:ADP-heptose:LPS heptosyltransferase